MARRRNISDELFEKIAESARLTPAFVVFMISSGVLAAVALLTNSVPVLIGAMVIAPAYPPLALVAFGLGAGRYLESLKGLLTALLGLALAVGLAIATTWFLGRVGILPADANLVQKPLLEERVRPGWYSIIAAVAAGLTGAIAIIKKKTDTLVGTVASVALVPAGAAAGIALISGDTLRAWGGLLLLLVNMMLIVATSLLVLVFANPDRIEARG